MDFDNLERLDSDDPDILRARLLAVNSALMTVLSVLSTEQVRGIGIALANFDTQDLAELPSQPFLPHFRDELDRLSLILLDVAAKR